MIICVNFLRNRIENPDKLFVVEGSRSREGPRPGQGRARGPLWGPTPHHQVLIDTDEVAAQKLVDPPQKVGPRLIR